MKLELAESASAYMSVILKCRLLCDYGVCKAREQGTPGGRIPGCHGLADQAVEVFCSVYSGLESAVLCSSRLG